MAIHPHVSGAALEAVGSGAANEPAWTIAAEELLVVPLTGIHGGVAVQREEHVALAALSRAGLDGVGFLGGTGQNEQAVQFASLADSGGLAGGCVVDARVVGEPGREQAPAVQVLRHGLERRRQGDAGLVQRGAAVLEQVDRIRCAVDWIPVIRGL